MVAPLLLAAIALWAGGKPVTVTQQGTGYLGGSAMVGGNQITLTAPVYRMALHGDGIGVFALLHETGHTTGIADECLADRFGLQHLKAAYHRFWPKLTNRQVSSRYSDAVAFTKTNGHNCSKEGKDERV